MQKLHINQDLQKHFLAIAAKIKVLKAMRLEHLSRKAAQGHLNALDKAFNMICEDYKYYKAQGEVYRVASSAHPDVYYNVTQTSCTCLAGQRGWACKHQYFVKLLVQLSQFKTS